MITNDLERSGTSGHRSTLDFGGRNTGGEPFWNAASDMDANVIPTGRYAASP
jgi:hypothetical protein